MRRNLSEGMFRPQSRAGQVLGGRRILQRASRAPAPLSKAQLERVRRATLRAIPVHVKSGSTVHVEVRAK